MPDSLTTTFINICESGNILDYDNLLSQLDKSQIKRLMEFNHSIAFYRAVKNGHASIVKRIFHSIKKTTTIEPREEALEPIFLTRNCAALKVALKKKYVDIIEIFLQEEVLFYICAEIILKKTKFIQLIWESTLTTYTYPIFLLACDRNVQAVQKIFQVIPNNYYINFITYTQQGLLNTPLVIASRNGHVATLNLFFNFIDAPTKEKLLKDVIPYCVIVAAQQGKTAVVKKFFQWLTPQQQINCLIYEDFNSFVYAADRGSIALLKLIWQRLPITLRNQALAASNFAAYRLAMRNHHQSVIKILEKFASDKTVIHAMKKATTEGVNP